MLLIGSNSLYAQEIPDSSRQIFTQAHGRITSGQATEEDYYQRGVIYGSIGQYDKAMSDYEMVINGVEHENFDLRFAAYTNRGSIHQRYKNYDKALKDFNEALQIKPSSALALNNRGFQHQLMENYDLAIIDFRRSIENDPSYTTPYVNLIDVYTIKKDRTAIEQTLELLIKNSKGDPRSYIHAADYYQSVGNFNAALKYWDAAVEASNSDPDFIIQRSKFKDDVINDDLGAIQDCKDAIAMNPNKSEYYYYLARPQYDLAEYTSVITNCEKAIALDPTYYDAIIMRANVLDMYGMSTEAKTEYLKAIKLRPNDYDGYRQLSVLYFNLNLLDSAIITVDAFLKNLPDTYNMVEQKAKILVAMSEFEKALLQFERCIEIDKANPAGYFFAGVICDSLNRKDKACDYMKQAMDIGLGEAFYYVLDNCPSKIDPKLRHQYQLFQQAVDFEKGRQYEKAITLYDQLIKVAPDSSGYYYNRGKNYRHLEMHKEAIENYKKAISIDSDRMDYWVSLAVSQQILNDVDGALKTYEDALKIDPNHAMTYYNLGTIYASKNQFEKAIEYLEQSINLNMNYGKAYLMLGDIYLHIGQNDKACNVLKIAESLGMTQAFGKRVKACQ